jgi:periplasmic protein TonB
MRRVTLLTALVLAAGCASASPPVDSASSSVTASEATVPGKIAFGPEAAAAHPYFVRVQEQIAAKWGFPLAARQSGLEGDVLIEFRVAKDGSLERAVVRRSSGTPAFDQTALTAVQGAQPLPPVPDEVAKQTVAVNATFRYRIEK